MLPLQLSDDTVVRGKKPAKSRVIPRNKTVIIAELTRLLTDPNLFGSSTIISRSGLLRGTAPITEVVLRGHTPLKPSIDDKPHNPPKKSEAQENSTLPQFLTVFWSEFHLP